MSTETAPLQAVHVDAVGGQPVSDSVLGAEYDG